MGSPQRPRGAWLTAAQAASALGVTRPTLYAYVSRGLLRSQAMPGASRARGYAREDIERLKRRTAERRNPDRAAAHALQWGLPILESAITLIDGRRLYYRGHDVLDLARTRSLPEVAALIWTGRFDGLPRVPAPRSRRLRINAPSRAPFVTRAQIALARAASQDPQAFDIRPEHVAACGWSILRLLTEAASMKPLGDVPIEGALAAVWHVDAGGADLLRAALILCADHELNVSSFTARAVASAGSSPYAVVMAGLSALEGPRHGGAAARVEAALAAMRRQRPLRAAIEARLRRGEPIDGFGHPLYPHGDPRALFLLDRLRREYGRSAELAYVTTFADTVSTIQHERPNVDFALAAVARVLRLPAEAPLVLFAIGRTIGWIGQAIEQYATGQLIRPRAKYVGVVPSDAPS